MFDDGNEYNVTGDEVSTRDRIPEDVLREKEPKRPEEIKDSNSQSNSINAENVDPWIDPLTWLNELKSTELGKPHRPKQRGATSPTEADIDGKTINADKTKSDYQRQIEGSYPKNWDILRRQAYQRDEYQCQNCGARGGPHGDLELHAHHIVPLSRGGNNVLSNLSTLCATCHGLIHDHLS